MPKIPFQLNPDENVRFDEKTQMWVAELYLESYTDGMKRWVAVAEFSSNGRAEAALKESRPEYNS